MAFKAGLDICFTPFTFMRTPELIERGLRLKLLTEVDKNECKSMRGGQPSKLGVNNFSVSDRLLCHFLHVGFTVPEVEESIFQ